MAASRREVLSLYKQLMRESGHFKSYIYRSHALRRVRDLFKEHKAVQDKTEINELFQEGLKNLEIIKRQVVIGNMYKSADSVVEKHFGAK
ncbi:LYR motif-containing protein 4B-like [Ixodes scapularis]|uniref:LYR motif-containing protein, putative n=3 Tax=Ixodes TaxID=6944 RepID=B7QAJ3_IXOSC|nr:LYR motif-containing protein 4B [Ixodes scapularis]XP_042144693.1 LYR motif-containing protein 4B-like [Ixodes scapularis]EEC15865.1 LYR motif-containing protein, putative [Ixodes scapularis]|eukprot:XP_002412569.1 LYR motif-containing protein, putative [Ixodes scapularis]